MANTVFLRDNKPTCGCSRAVCPVRCWATGSYVCTVRHRICMKTWPLSITWIIRPHQKAVRSVCGSPVLRWTHCSSWTGVYGDINSRRRRIPKTVLRTNSLRLFSRYVWFPEEPAIWLSAVVWLEEPTPARLSVVVWPKEPAPARLSVVVWLKEPAPPRLSVVVWPKEPAPARLSVVVWLKEPAPARLSVAVWPKEPAPARLDLVVPSPRELAPAEPSFLDERFPEKTCPESLSAVVRSPGEPTPAGRSTVVRFREELTPAEP